MAVVVQSGLYRSFTRYWRRRKYDRLDGSTPGRRRRTVRAQSDLPGGKRRWRVRVLSRVRIASPKAFLLRLRDGYANLMLRLANSAALSGGGYVSHPIGLSRPFGGATPSLKEYDEKVLVEIYKSIIAQGRLTPASQR